MAGLRGGGRGEGAGGWDAPSPQGDLRVVMRRTLVGMRTGPFTFSCFSLAPRIRSAHTGKEGWGITRPKKIHNRGRRPEEKRVFYNSGGELQTAIHVQKY